MNTAWREHAACSGHNPETWFPDGYTARYTTRIQRAKHVCWACPVRIACLDDALDREGDAAARHRHGIRGGLDPEQRWRIRQQFDARKAAA